MEEMGNTDQYYTHNSVAAGTTATENTKEVIKGEDSNCSPQFTQDEEELIARMFNLVGQRWSLIAGRIPGRTAREIEKYWISRSST